ncbi:MAG TPA: hypothetical protein VGM56_01450 [Byssovorax sp.]|jgi:hypothetical protein
MRAEDPVASSKTRRHALRALAAVAAAACLASAAPACTETEGGVATPTSGAGGASASSGAGSACSVAADCPGTDECFTSACVDGACTRKVDVLAACEDEGICYPDGSCRGIPECEPDSCATGCCTKVTLDEQGITHATCVDEGGACPGGAVCREGACVCGALPPSCTPGDTEPCYDGPPGTEGTGSCQGGVRTCNATGDAFGACTAEVLPAVADCADPSATSCSVASSPVCLTTTWSETVQGASAGVYGVALDPSGDLFALLAGAAGTLQVGAHTVDLPSSGGAVLARLDPTGNPRWLRAWSSDDLFALQVIAVGDGGAIVYGSTYHTITVDGHALQHGFVFRVDDTGAVVWSRADFDGPMAMTGVEFFGAAIDANGTLWTTGRFDSADFGSGAVPGGYMSAFLVGLDVATGATKVSTTWATGEEQGYSVALSPDGGVFVSSSYDQGANGCSSSDASTGSLRRFDDDTTPTWVQTYAGGLGFRHLEPDGQGGVVGMEIGDTSRHANRAVDLGGGTIVTGAFVVRIDGGGALTWVRQLDDTGGFDSAAPHVDSHGQILVIGDAERGMNLGFGDIPKASAFVARLDAQGNLLSTTPWLTPSSGAPPGSSGAFGPAVFTADDQLVVGAAYAGTVRVIDGAILGPTAGGTQQALIAQIAP